MIYKWLIKKWLTDYNNKYADCVPYSQEGGDDLLCDKNQSIRLLIKYYQDK